MTDKDKEELLKVMYKNEDDYWELPHYGLISNWFVRYWELHNKLLTLLGEETYDYPMESYNEFQSNKK